MYVCVYVPVALYDCVCVCMYVCMYVCTRVDLPLKGTQVVAAELQCVEMGVQRSDSAARATKLSANLDAKARTASRPGKQAGQGGQPGQGRTQARAATRPGQQAGQGTKQARAASRPGQRSKATWAAKWPA